MNTRKRQDLTNDIKLKIIQEVDENEKRPSSLKKKRFEIAAEFKIKPSSLSCIIKARERIESRIYQADRISTTKRFRTANKFPEIDTALLEWFKVCRNSTIAVSDDFLLAKARAFISSLQVEGDISMSWVQRWKARHDIILKKICGESASVTENSISDWYKITLPNILKQFPSENVFNSDETGLFWKLSPTNTLAFKDEKCHGGKRAKDRVTVFVGASMTGEKLPLLIIGKSESPRAFRNKHVPLDYTSNKKAWMTSAIFEMYIRKIDKRMVSASRRIAMIVDNCPSHFLIKNLKAVTLFFLPPNTTSKTQPMDNGVIWSLKSHYRKSLMAQLLILHDAKKIFKANLLTSLIWLKNAWESVKTETIVNCFKVSGFVQESSNISTPTSPCVTQEISADLGNIFHQLRVAFSLPETITMAALNTIDADIITSQPCEESTILASISNRASTSYDDKSCEDLEEEEIQSPSPAEALEMVQQIRLCLLQHSSSPNDFTSLNTIETSLTNVALNYKRQSTLDNFVIKNKF